MTDARARQALIALATEQVVEVVATNTGG